MNGNGFFQGLKIRAIVDGSIQFMGYCMRNPVYVCTLELEDDGRSLAWTLGSRPTLDSPELLSQCPRIDFPVQNREEVEMTDLSSDRWVKSIVSHPLEGEL